MKLIRINLIKGSYMPMYAEDSLGGSEEVDDSNNRHSCLTERFEDALHASERLPREPPCAEPLLLISSQIFFLSFTGI